jgi:hypothetical protein
LQQLRPIVAVCEQAQVLAQTVSIALEHVENLLARKNRRSELKPYYNGAIPAIEIIVRHFSGSFNETGRKRLGAHQVTN